MNDDDATLTNPILAKALRILTALSADGGDPEADWTDALVSELSSLLPQPAQCDALIGADTAGPGLRWHADQLASLAGAPAATRAEQARLRYHARMLGHSLAPDRAEFRPLVTVLIPVYNRAGPLVEAVQSCIDQSWRPIEILVIDDGSTDDVPSALRRFGDQVRLIRQDNGGDASARNLGLARAQGDFIHFLDSDDLLTPEAVESKLAAFRSVSDADLCYGQAQRIDMRVSPPAVKERRTIELDHPLRSMVVGFPFHLQMVMMPRWRFLAAPFEGDLRRSSDFRCWQCFSIAGIRVIGTRQLGTLLRRFHDSLHMTPEAEDDSHAVALMRGLRDIARNPHVWRHGAAYLNPIATQRSRYWLESRRSERVYDAAAEAVEALDQAARRSPSSLPMFAAMRTQRQRLRHEGQWPDAAPDSIYRQVTDAIDRCCTKARRLDDHDLEFWSPEGTDAISDGRLERFFAAIRKHGGRRGDASLASALLRYCPGIPQARIVRRAGFWRRLLGAEIAARLAAHQMARRRA
jgi:glycosyltransferase involved in cell wall biosynthesis